MGNTSRRLVSTVSHRRPSTRLAGIVLSECQIGNSIVGRYTLMASGRLSSHSPDPMGHKPWTVPRLEALSRHDSRNLFLSSTSAHICRARSLIPSTPHVFFRSVNNSSATFSHVMPRRCAAARSREFCGKKKISSGIGMGGSRHVMGQVGDSDRGGIGTKYRDVERWKGSGAGKHRC